MTFFDKYSFKQKNYALAILSVLLIAVAYKRAFKESIETRNYKKELETKLVEAQTADQKIRSEQTAIVALNAYLGKENSSVEKVQQGFLNFFANHAEGLSVYQIDEVLSYQHPDFSINTHRIVIKGGFNESLKFIYSLENQFDLAKLLNVEFEFKKFTSDQEKELYTTLLIQNYLR